MIAIGVEPDGFNINEASGTTAPQQLAAAVKRGNIDFEELHQVPGETGDRKLPFHMLEYATLCGTHGSAHQMDRHIQREFLVHRYFIEVGMVIDRLDRVGLKLLEHDCFARAALT